MYVMLFCQVLETACYKVPIDFYEKHVIDCIEASFKGLYYCCVRYFQKTKLSVSVHRSVLLQETISVQYLEYSVSLIKCEQEDDFLKGIVHPQARCTRLSSFGQIVTLKKAWVFPAL